MHGKFASKQDLSIICTVELALNGQFWTATQALRSLYNVFLVHFNVHMVTNVECHQWPVKLRVK